MPIPGHSGIGMEWNFSLSDRAMLSGSSEIRVIPEPAGVLLLAAGFGLVRRR
jgi:hypothetical protein